MSVRSKASAGAQRWNNQWWDYVKNNTPLPADKRKADKKPALRFIIVKSTRYVDEATVTAADAYAGKTCARVNVEPGKVYDSFEAAQADAAKLATKNSAGFDVLTLPAL